MHNPGTLRWQVVIPALKPDSPLVTLLKGWDCGEGPSPVSLWRKGDEAGHLLAFFKFFVSQNHPLRQKAIRQGKN